MYEAVDAGIPVLGFLLDQPRNIERLVHEEMEISLDLLSLSKDRLSAAIVELISNEKWILNFNHIFVCRKKINVIMSFILYNNCL